MPRTRKFFMAGLAGLVATGGALFGAAGAGATSAGPHFKGAPVVIGSEGCQTGYLSTADLYLPQMAQLAINRINAAGGVLGHKLELKALDTQCIATNEIVDANQLVQQDHAVAIIGGYQSAALEGLIPTVQNDHVPFIAAGTLNTQAGWGITTFPPNANYADTTVGFVKKFFPKAKTLANVSGNTPYGLAVQQDTQQYANQHGLKTIQQEISNTATDATPILQQVSNSDVFMSNTSGPINLIFAANAQSLGFHMPMIFEDGRTDCIPMQQKYTNGKIYCELLATSLLDVQHNSTLRNNMNTAWAAWKSHRGTIATFTPSAWDQIYLLANAMTQAGTVTNGAKIEAKLTHETFTGAAAVYSFKPGYSFGVKGNPYDVASPTSNSMKLDYVPSSGY